MKLPCDIVDAKSSHADSGVWTYPLKKTLPGVIVCKNAVLVGGITLPEIAGSWRGPVIGGLGWGRGSAAICGNLHLPEEKKV